MSKEAQPLDNHAPRTEEEIRAYTIGELKPLSSRILIVEYDPRWPDLFAREADRIRSLLGSRALRIEHAGSTSVPGLAAKPIIDLLVMVADWATEDGYVPALEAAGYVLRIEELVPTSDVQGAGHGYQPARIFIRLSRNRPHAGVPGLVAQQCRRSRSVRAHQAGLGAKEWKYVQNYADAKVVVIEEIIARARVASEMNETADVRSEELSQLFNTGC